MRTEPTPSLKNVYVASPCNVDWNSMSGDDRVRFCGSCSKNVYDISKLSRPEAEAFLQANGVSKCVQFYRRKDGTIITDDCPVGLRKIRDGALAVARFAASIVAGVITICFSITAASARESSASKFPKELNIHACFPIATRGDIAFRDFYLPSYTVLTTGKYALGDELLKNDENGKEQLYLRERDGVRNIGVDKQAKSLSGGVSATDLPWTLEAKDVFDKGKMYERDGMPLTAESMYKITLKFFEQFPSEYGTSFKNSVVLQYAGLLGRLHRNDEAVAILNDFSVASTKAVSMIDDKETTPETTPETK